MRATDDADVTVGPVIGFTCLGCGSTGGCLAAAARADLQAALPEGCCIKAGEVHFEAFAPTSGYQACHIATIVHNGAERRLMIAVDVLRDQTARLHVTRIVADLLEHPEVTMLDAAKSTCTYGISNMVAEPSTQDF